MEQELPPDFFLHYRVAIRTTTEDHDGEQRMMRVITVDAGEYSCEILKAPIEQCNLTTPTVKGFLWPVLSVFVINAIKAVLYLLTFCDEPHQKKIRAIENYGKQITRSMKKALIRPRPAGRPRRKTNLVDVVDVVDGLPAPANQPDVAEALDVSVRGLQKSLPKGFWMAIQDPGLRRHLKKLKEKNYGGELVRRNW
jgi:hypothetical protein